MNQCSKLSQLLILCLSLGFFSSCIVVDIPEEFEFLGKANNFSFDQPSPAASNTTKITVSWDFPDVVGLDNQILSIYTNASCTGIANSTKDILMDLRSYTFDVSQGITYSIKIESLNTKGKSNKSNCSPEMTISSTLSPAAATNLSWLESSPSNLSITTASWTPSVSATLSSQAITYFTDATCTSPEGTTAALIPTAATHVFTNSGVGTYYFNIQSADSSSIFTTSICSPLYEIVLLNVPISKSASDKTPSPIKL